MSIAAKDFQALERLLSEVPRDAYTCGFAMAIAHYQSELAAEVLDAWTREGGFRHAALSAGGDNDEYADDSEVARDLMRVLTESIEALISQKLERPLGESAAKAKPKRAESWRSRRSLRNVVLNLESLRALVETPGGLGDLVTAHRESELAHRLGNGFADAVSRAQTVILPLRDAVLNLDTMSSSLAIVDTVDGGLVRSATLGTRHPRLSIRHLDVDGDTRVVVAMQHEALGNSA